MREKPGVTHFKKKTSSYANPRALIKLPWSTLACLHDNTDIPWVGSGTQKRRSADRGGNCEGCCNALVNGVMI
jgi:hypothetical protein